MARVGCIVLVFTRMRVLPFGRGNWPLVRKTTVYRFRKSNVVYGISEYYITCTRTLVTVYTCQCALHLWCCDSDRYMFEFCKGNLSMVGYADDTGKQLADAIKTSHHEEVIKYNVYFYRDPNSVLRCWA